MISLFNYIEDTRKNMIHEQYSDFLRFTQELIQLDYLKDGSLEDIELRPTISVTDKEYNLPF